MLIKQLKKEKSGGRTLYALPMACLSCLPVALARLRCPVEKEVVGGQRRCCGWFSLKCDGGMGGDEKVWVKFIVDPACGNIPKVT